MRQNFLHSDMFCPTPTILLYYKQLNNTKMKKEIFRLKRSDVEYGILQSIPKQIDLRDIGDKHILIKDSMGSVRGNIHSSANRIDGLTDWHRKRMTNIGDELKITYDKNEIENGLHVINIEFLNQRTEMGKESHEACFSFISEDQLESFLIENIDELEPGLTLVERQYKIGANIIDLLCVDKDRNYVVVEIKNRKTSDQVVGQMLRYMECVKELNNVETVRGIIVTPEYEKNLEYAISNLNDVSVKYFKVKIEFSDGENN